MCHTVIDRLCPPSPPKLFPPDLSDRRVQDIAIGVLMVFGGMLLLWLAKPTLECRVIASTISAMGCVLILISYYSPGPEPKPSSQKKSLGHIIDLSASKCDPTNLEDAYVILGVPEGEQGDKESILRYYMHSLTQLTKRKKAVEGPLTDVVQELIQDCKAAFQTIQAHLGDPWPSFVPSLPPAPNDLD